MAKVKFFCNSGANIHSCRVSETLDTVDDLGFDVGEWEKLEDIGKYEAAEEWANERLEIYWKEE